MEKGKQIPIFCFVSDRSIMESLPTYIVAGTSEAVPEKPNTGGIFIVAEGIIIDLPPRSVAELSELIKEIEIKDGV